MKLKKLALPMMALGLTTALVGCNSSLDVNNKVTENTTESKTDSTTTNNNTVDSSTTNSSTNQSTEGYVSISDTFKMMDSITDSYYKGSDKSVEQLYVETVEKTNDSIVNLYVSSNTSSGQGSGVLFGYDETYKLSYVLTCFHMIEDMSSVKVEDVTGATYTAMVVGGYEDQDLAIIAINTPTDHELTYASLLDKNSKIYTGQTAIAIGNNDGYSHTVSDGIVSYASRAWTTSLYNYKTINQIQITTEINGGNSGGGLFSTSGALIGITNAGVETSTSGSSIEGVKFAVSYQEMWNVIENFIGTAKYSVESNSFKEGYVLGDYEFGSTFSLTTYGNMWNYEYVIYVASTSSSNETYSDYNVFSSGDIIKSYTINFKDSSKQSITLKLSNPESTEEFYTTLYNSNVSIGDTITFNILRYNDRTRSYQEKEVSLTITQYTYQF